MRKLIAAIAALALLLGACSAIVPADETTTQTTRNPADEATRPPTEPFTPTGGEENGIAWRTLDLDDEENAELRAWLATEVAREREEHNQLREEMRQIADEGLLQGHYWGHGVYTRGRLVCERELLFRCPVTGDETVLFRAHCVGEGPDSPYHNYCNGCREAPRFIATLDQRNFLYTLFDVPTATPFAHGVFDTQTLQAHPFVLENPQIVLLQQRGNRLFWKNDDENLGPHSGYISLYTADLDDLPNLTLTNLLADIAHPPAEHVWTTLLSPNERFYFVVCINGLYNFDLQEQTLFYLPWNEVQSHNWPSAHYTYLLMRDNNTLLWFVESHMHFAVEITLP